MLWIWLYEVLTTWENLENLPIGAVCYDGQIWKTKQQVSVFRRLKYPSVLTSK